MIWQILKISEEKNKNYRMKMTLEEAKKKLLKIQRNMEDGLEKNRAKGEQALKNQKKIIKQTDKSNPT